MAESARSLGYYFGLAAHEMNRLLVKLGYLEGVPRYYSLTEKARPFANEKYYANHTELVYKDEFLETLKTEVTPELIKWAREDYKSIIEDQRLKDQKAREEYLAEKRAKEDAKYNQNRSLMNKKPAKIDSTVFIAVGTVIAATLFATIFGFKNDSTK